MHTAFNSHIGTSAFMLVDAVSCASRTALFSKWQKALGGTAIACTLQFLSANDTPGSVELLTPQWGAQAALEPV